MKKFALLFLVIILLINTTYALKVDFSCPEVVFVNEEFICLLQAEDFEGVYDVKVDISVGNKNIAPGYLIFTPASPVRSGRRKRG